MGTIGLRARAIGTAAAIVLAVGVSGATAQAAENPAGSPAGAHAAAFECPENELCIYDSPDGVGDSHVVDIQWAGGYPLEEVGWKDRASAYRNNFTSDATFYLYDRHPKLECWVLRATVEPNTFGPLPPQADNNIDLVANMRFPECPGIVWPPR